MESARILMMLAEALKRQTGTSRWNEDEVNKICERGGYQPGALWWAIRVRNALAHGESRSEMDINRACALLRTAVRGAGGQIAAVGALDRHMEVFRLCDDDHCVEHRWYLPGEGWSAWDLLPSGFPAPAIDLAATSWGRDHVEVFVLGSDLTVWHTWWRENGGWHGEWAPRGNKRVEPPIAATSMSEGHVDLMAFEKGSMIGCHYNNGWSRWDRR